MPGVYMPQRYYSADRTRHWSSVNCITNSSLMCFCITAHATLIMVLYMEYVLARSLFVLYDKCKCVNNFHVHFIIVLWEIRLCSIADMKVIIVSWVKDSGLAVCYGSLMMEHSFTMHVSVSFNSLCWLVHFCNIGI